MAVNVEQNIGGNKQYLSVLLDERCEGPVKVRTGSGLEHKQLQRRCGHCRLQIPRVAFGIWIVRVDQHTSQRRLRNEITQQLEPLRFQRADLE